MKPEYQFLGLAILAIIVLSLTVSCTNFIPYSGVSLKYSNYEGFSGLKPIEYTSQKENAAMDSYTSLLTNGFNGECKKVDGFDGLYCKPYVADAKIDIYSGTSGSLSCKDSGLTNSQGGLCLDANQKKLLTTRGGNASGVI